MLQKKCGALHEKREREKKRKRCTREEETGWSGGGTGSALPGCAMFQPEHFAQVSVRKLPLSAMIRDIDLF